MKQQCKGGLGVVVRLEMQFGQLVDVADVHLLPFDLVLVEMLQKEEKNGDKTLNLTYVKNLLLDVLF